MYTSLTRPDATVLCEAVIQKTKKKKKEIYWRPWLVNSAPQSWFEIDYLFLKNSIHIVIVSQNVSAKKKALLEICKNQRNLFVNTL